MKLKVKVGDKIIRIRDTSSISYDTTVFDIPEEDQEVETVTWVGMNEVITDLCSRYDHHFSKDGVDWVSPATISRYYLNKLYEKVEDD